MLRCAVIGCGRIGLLHIQAISSCGLAKLVAISEINSKRALSISKKFDVPSYRSFEEMLKKEKIDVVTVATPIENHYKPVISALEKGCHVFCEKPLTTSLREAKYLVSLANRKRFLAVNFNRRYSFGYRKAKEIISSGRLGNLIYITIRMCNGPFREPFSKNKYALFFIMHAHGIDLLRYFGGEIERVAAYLHGSNESDEYTNAGVLAYFKTGSVGILVGGTDAKWPFTNEYFEVGCTKGRIEVEDAVRKVQVRFTDKTQDVIEMPNPFGEEVNFWHSITLHIHNFIKCISKGVKPLVTGADGLRSLEVIYAIIKSHESGKITYVRQNE